MNSWSDNLTGILRTITDVMLVKNPLETAMGVLFGLIIHGLAIVIGPFIERTITIQISSLNYLHYIAFGIFAFNIKNFANRHKAPPEIEEAFALIQEKVELGEITAFDAKLLRKNLIIKVVDNVQLDAETRSKANLVALIKNDD